MKAKPRRAIETTPTQISFNLSSKLAALLLKHDDKPAEIHPAIGDALNAWADGRQGHRLTFTRVGSSTMPGVQEARAFAKTMTALFKMGRFFKSESSREALRWRVNSIHKWRKTDIVTVIGSLEETT